MCSDVNNNERRRATIFRLEPFDIYDCFVCGTKTKQIVFVVLFPFFLHQDYSQDAGRGRFYVFISGVAVFLERSRSRM